MSLDYNNVVRYYNTECDFKTIPRKLGSVVDFKIFIGLLLLIVVTTITSNCFILCPIEILIYIEWFCDRTLIEWRRNLYPNMAAAMPICFGVSGVGIWQTRYSIHLPCSSIKNSGQRQYNSKTILVQRDGWKFELIFIGLGRYFIRSLYRYMGVVVYQLCLIQQVG